MRDLAILICCYNRQEALIRQLDYLATNVIKHKNRIVVRVHDDGSKYPLVISNCYDFPVFLTRSDDNFGLISARNSLIKSAAENFCIFLDDDLFIFNIDSFIDDSESVICKEFPVAYVPYVNLPLSAKSRIENFKYICNFKKNNQNVVNFNGGASFFRKSIFDELGGLYGDYYIYLEEEDFCLRMFAQGLSSIRLDSGSYIGIHDQAPGKNTKERLVFLLSNRLLFHKRFVSFFLLRLLLNIMYSLLYAFKMRDSTLLRKAFSRYSSMRGTLQIEKVSTFVFMRFSLKRYFNV